MESADRQDTIQPTWDTFPDGGAISCGESKRARHIHGPYPDLQTAQKLQADQTALLKQTSEALREQLRRATSALG